MSIEEKAKAYDEALGKIKVLQEDWKSTHNRAWKEIEEVFPQLVESEDERIRKELMRFCDDASKSKTRVVSAEKFLEWASWLEKQKEQNHDGKKWIYEDDYDKDIERSFNEGKDEVLENPEKYGLQKDQRSNIELIKRAWYMEGYMDREYNREPKWIVKTGEDGPRYEENPRYGQSLEQKSTEWSEKDDEIRKALIAFLEMNTGYFSCNGFTKDDIVQWLKSPNSQPKQEWSEEDEEMAMKIDRYLSSAIGVSEEERQNIQKWLKSYLTSSNDGGMSYLSSTGSVENLPNGGTMQHKIGYLEEQKEQKTNPYTGVGFDYNGHHWGMCARDSGVEIIVDGKIRDRVFPAEWSEAKELVFKDICNHLEVEGYDGWVLLLNALRNGEFQPKHEYNEGRT